MLVVLLVGDEPVVTVSRKLITLEVVCIKMHFGLQCYSRYSPVASDRAEANGRRLGGKKELHCIVSLALRAPFYFLFFQNFVVVHRDG